MFECDKCGECCRRLKGISIYAELDRGDGICKYLKGNLCSIYEDRPLFCRIDDCYTQFFKEEYTREEFYKLNYEICNKLKNKELCF
jgi:Fe-S-cluster containining protein